jgi:hypothetical protein
LGQLFPIKIPLVPDGPVGKRACIAVSGYGNRVLVPLVNEMATDVKFIPAQTMILPMNHRELI